MLCMVHTMLDSLNNETTSQQCYQLLTYEEEDTFRQDERGTVHTCIDKCITT